MVNDWNLNYIIVNDMEVNQYEDHMNQIKMAIIQASTPIASSLQCLQSVSYEIFLGKLSETHIRHKQ
jgi:hypothetical protein